MASILRLSIVLAGLAALSQPARADLDCSERERSSRRATHCEMREMTLPATGRLTVDARTNGGISVKGWLRGEILVRAQVRAQAATEAEARSIVSQVRVNAAASEVRADGPTLDRDSSWSVSYEIFVPERTDLNLKTHNGGISISEVRGQIEFEALNGGVALKHLAGRVRGHTTNGGLSIELTGDRWDGDEFDAGTTNGGVSLTLPVHFSAQLETRTVNGRIHVDFPVTVQGEIGGSLSVTLGGGGPRVRAITVNGGVSIRRKT